MKVAITELLIVFDELVLEFTDEELGVYWLRYKRKDNLTISLSYSIYENYVNVSIYNNFDVGMANIRMKNCSEIRILDEKKRCLEIVHEGNQARCFISLSGDDIINYNE